MYSSVYYLALVSRSVELSWTWVFHCWVLVDHTRCSPDPECYDVILNNLEWDDEISIASALGVPGKCKIKMR
jgi:hypothetical protein